jgi:Fic family protein
MPTMQSALKIVSAIESYNGNWLNIEELDDAPLHELRTIATVESIGSSTRIEGSALDDTVIDKFIQQIEVTKFTSRDEQEVAGYYKALDLIVESYVDIPLTENNIKHLHKQLLQFAAKDKKHFGEYKKHSNAVVATYPDGQKVLVFETTSPMLTPMAMQQAVAWTNKALLEKKYHPLVVIAAFVYEFLSIHPFTDGNGRLSRLLTTLLLLRAGYSYVQYISFEHQIELRKKDYYSTLRAGQAGRGTASENINDWLVYFLSRMEKMTFALDKKYTQLKRRGNYLNPRQMKIVQFVKRKGFVKLGDLSASFKDVSNATLKKDLQLLVKKNKLSQTGKLKGTMYNYEQD